MTRRELAETALHAGADTVDAVAPSLPFASALVARFATALIRRLLEHKPC